jgi:hypothetical protein
MPGPGRIRIGGNERQGGKCCEAESEFGHGRPLLLGVRSDWVGIAPR